MSIVTTRSDLLRELEETDQRTRLLIEDLSDQQLAVPYHRGINPPIWEVGHSAFFYEYFLLREVEDQTPRMPGYDDVWDSFEIMHKHRWSEGVVPELRRTLDYYTGILEEARKRLEHDLDQYEHYLFRYVIAHHQMHIESLIWARQTLAYPKPTYSNGDLATLTVSRGSGDLLVEGGEYPIGMPADAPDYATKNFSFDSERPGFLARVESFKISKTLVSNREFLEFVEDEGYKKESLWSFGGRCWLAEGEDGGRSNPVYWRRAKDGSWQQRHFEQWIDLLLDAPILHVSFWEAEAFCNWAGRRLPSEHEWEAAARGRGARHFPWGEEMVRNRVDMDAQFLGTAPVNAFAQGATPEGCLQMIGTAWEWTSSQFLPYDGFKIDMYKYMSVLQFGDHKVTKGGSCATCSSLIRNTYRQAYFPGRTDVFTGFRHCARK